MPTKAEAQKLLVRLARRGTASRLMQIRGKTLLRIENLSAILHHAVDRSKLPT
jgi:hypothetical protein